MLLVLLQVGYYRKTGTSTICPLWKKRNTALDKCYFIAVGLDTHKIAGISDKRTEVTGGSPFPYEMRQIILYGKYVICFYYLCREFGKETPEIAAALDNIFLAMNWIILIIAGCCEVGFAYCLGRAKDAVGWEWWAWIAGFIIFTIASMGLLAKATRTLPIGTAYPVWTGIGAVGTVLVGIFLFHEPATFWRIFFIVTLIASIIGLKMVS